MGAVYIRSPYGHDLGKVLKSVVFTLHPSFNNHIRGAATSMPPLPLSAWARVLEAAQYACTHSHAPSSYAAHTEVMEHPFEVTEKGWGEFEALVELNFQDAHEKSVELRHFVKLFHGNNPDAAPANKKVGMGGVARALGPPPSPAHPTNKTHPPQPVVHEYYDEVVITDPTEGFHEQLQRLAETKTPRHTLHVRTPLSS